MFAPPTIETRHFTIALEPGTGAICGLRHKKTGRDWASARQPLALFAVVDIRFSWFGKAANRMPEALWLTFQPAVSDPQGWLLDKSDGAVSPFDVVTGGNRAMHAVLGGLRYQGRKAPSASRHWMRPFSRWANGCRSTSREISPTLRKASISACSTTAGARTTCSGLGRTCGSGSASPCSHRLRHHRTEAAAGGATLRA